MTFHRIILFFLFFAYQFGLAAKAQLNLDLEIRNLLLSTKQNPFVSYPNSLRHGSYANLKNLATQLGTQVKWTSSVASSVKQLPFNESRIIVFKDDEFDGWFDEYVTPQLILIHKQATLVTMIHELRHALHLGKHLPKSAGVYDKFLYNMNQTTIRFHQTIELDRQLTQSRKLKIKSSTKKLVETFSELIAHNGDYCLAKIYRPDLVKSNVEFLKEYKREFEFNFVQLSKLGLQLKGSYVEILRNKMHEYWNHELGKCYF